MVPHVAAPVPAELAEEARRVAERLRSSEPSEEVRDDAVRVILRLTDAGLKSFFLAPVDRLGLGFIGRSAVEVGLRTASGAIGVFVKRLARSMDREQGRILGEILDDILVDLDFGDLDGEEDGVDEDATGRDEAAG